MKPSDQTAKKSRRLGVARAHRYAEANRSYSGLIESVDDRKNVRRRLLVWPDATDPLAQLLAAD
jgi:hypothetical protein